MMGCFSKRVPAKQGPQNKANLSWDERRGRVQTCPPGWSLKMPITIPTANDQHKELKAYSGLNIISLIALDSILR